MRKLFVSACSLFLCHTLSAQTEINKVNIAGGPSMHGTGDLKGFAVSLTYEHELNRRFSFANALTTTIHYGEDDMPGMADETMLMHFTTAGIQLNSYGQFHIVAKRDQNLSFGLGALLRFQSCSLPWMYGYTNDPNVYPEPFYVLRYDDKANTLCPGYSMSLTFRNRIASRYFIGIRAGFQNDTNGDAITSVSLLFERVLPRFRNAEK
jgi:hypothetical protein